MATVVSYSNIDKIANEIEKNAREQSIEFNKSLTTPIGQLPGVSGFADDFIKTKQEENSKWPTTKLGKPLSGRQERCPVCYQLAPIEFAQEHYQKEHGDI